MTDPTGAVAPPAQESPTAARAWRLSPSVALRPEPFGALAYDFHTRQLSFLKTPTLVAVVRGLADAEDAAGALEAAGVAADERPTYLAALETLARTGIIEHRG